MIRWIETLADWDRALPAALVAIDLSPGQPDTLLHALASRALERAPEAVEVTQQEGQAPAIARPAGSGLHLSKARRGPFVAVAIADDRVGIDVEGVEPDGEIPWNVLHPAEAAMLRSQDASAQAPAFARLWSLKEAYLKALGTGLLREPSSFVVRFVGDARAMVDDPAVSPGIVAAETIWRSAGAMTVAISAVLLAPDA